MAHTVTMSLSDEAFEVWRAFPKGTRSPSIAALLEDAKRLEEIIKLLEHKDRAFAQAQSRIRRLELSNGELRHFGCMCVVGGVGPKEVDE